MSKSDVVPSSMGFRAPAAEYDAVLRRRVDVLESVLEDRERELLELKGPCSSQSCRLHYAHSGPCDVRRSRSYG